MKPLALAMSQFGVKAYCGLQHFCLSLFAATLVACAGCGEAKQVVEGRAVASGTVTLDGQPLPAGSVAFVSRDGVRATTMIRPDGKYVTQRAAVGKNAVTIDTRSIQFGDPANYVPIPAKYGIPGASGFIVDIEPGENSIDLVLEK